MDEEFPLPDLSHGLPVFPLPNVFLFPGTRMNLNIFEPRYRNLMADTLLKPEAEHCFAMGTELGAPVDDSLGDPPVLNVAGVGRIVEYSRSDDGRFQLTLQGIGRARLTSERPLQNLYRLFEARWLQSTGGDADEQLLYGLGMEIRALVVELLRENAQQFREMLTAEIPLEVLLNLLSGWLPFDEAYRIRQMTVGQVVQRAAHAIAELESRIKMPGAKPLKPDDAPSAN